MTIQEFIKENECNSFTREKDYKEYACYEIWDKSDSGTKTGYPIFALEKDGEIRLSTPEETLEIMKITE